MALKELEARYTTKRAKDYKLSDGGRLYLLVRPNGSKLWRLKYRVDGKEKLLSLGRYPDLSLAQARLLRAEAKMAFGKGYRPGRQGSGEAATRLLRKLRELGTRTGLRRLMQVTRQGC